MFQYCSIVQKENLKYFQNVYISSILLRIDSVVFSDCCIINFSYCRRFFKELVLGSKCTLLWKNDITYNTRMCSLNVVCCCAANVHCLVMHTKVIVSKCLCGMTLYKAHLICTTRYCCDFVAQIINIMLFILYTIICSVWFRHRNRISTKQRNCKWCWLMCVVYLLQRWNVNATIHMAGTYIVDYLRISVYAKNCILLLDCIVYNVYIICISVYFSVSVA